MRDNLFEKIKSAFLENFDDVDVINKTTDLTVRFKNEEDFDWFNKNIVYIKDTDESPITFLISSSPLKNTVKDSSMTYDFVFKVKNHEKLIELINCH